MDTQIITTLTSEELENLIQKAVSSAIINLMAHEPKKKGNKLRPIKTEEATRFLNISKPTLYRYVSDYPGFPYYRSGKKLMFFQEELLNWIKSKKK